MIVDKCPPQYLPNIFIKIHENTEGSIIRYPLLIIRYQLFKNQTPRRRKYGVGGSKNLD